jgi:hypothetical protein
VAGNSGTLSGKSHVGAMPSSAAVVGSVGGGKSEAAGSGAQSPPLIVSGKGDDTASCGGERQGTGMGQGAGVTLAHSVTHRRVDGRWASSWRRSWRRQLSPIPLDRKRMKFNFTAFWSTIESQTEST